MCPNYGDGRGVTRLRAWEVITGALPGYGPDLPILDVPGVPIPPRRIRPAITSNRRCSQNQSSCGRNQMTATREQISQLLREASETHHRVFRIVDGADDDWASWYAWWLINLSELPAVLETPPVRSELIYLLVDLDKRYTAERPSEPWESYYARRILDHFHPARA
jgi:hypothetical protein